MKGDIDSTTIVVGNFNTPFTPTDRSFRQKIKEAQTLNEGLDQTDLIDIHRAFHPKAAEYTFYSNAHRTFSKITSWVTSLLRLKKIEIIKASFLITML